MPKQITLRLTKTEFEIISAALVAAVAAETFATRIIRAAEKSQGVEPVAGGSEEMEAIEQVIHDAFGTFWAHGPLFQAA